MDESTIASSPLHILAYTDAQGIGGAEISLGHLVATVSDEFRITVVGVEPTVVEAIAHHRPQARRICLSNRGQRSVLAHLSTFHRLRPDLIHCNLCTPWACATALTAALCLPQSRVVRVDQLPLRTTDATALWRTRALSLRVDAHVAVGEASARRMEDFYALGRDSVQSIPNGVPDRTDSPVSPPARPAGDLIVGMVGRLDAMKGHDLLLRAIAQVDGVRVVILGDGAERAALETLAHQLGVSDRLEWMGWVQSSPDYLPWMDVVTLPSRSEGFPLAMVEAMLAARPVIATRVGSMPEAIIPGQTGLLIDKNDADGLAIALRQLRDDPSLRQRLGQQARKMALAQFTANTMARRYETLWRRVIHQPRASRLRIPHPKA